MYIKSKKSSIFTGLRGNLKNNLFDSTTVKQINKIPKFEIKMLQSGTEEFQIICQTWRSSNSSNVVTDLKPPL